MTDLELAQGGQRMKEDRPQGFVRTEGIVREKCKMVHEIVGDNVYTHLMMTQMSIYKEAATFHTKCLRIKYCVVPLRKE